MLLYWGNTEAQCTCSTSEKHHLWNITWKESKRKDYFARGSKYSMPIPVTLPNPWEQLYVHIGHQSPLSLTSALSFWPFLGSQFLCDTENPKMSLDAGNYPEHSVSYAMDPLCFLFCPMCCWDQQEKALLSQLFFVLPEQKASCHFLATSNK